MRKWAARTAGSALPLRFFFFSHQSFYKYALVIFIAIVLAIKATGYAIFAVGFLPHVLVMVAVAFIILMQPDLRTAVILTLVGFLMLFVRSKNIPPVWLPGSVPAVRGVRGNGRSVPLGSVGSFSQPVE